MKNFILKPLLLIAYSFTLAATQAGDWLYTKDEMQIKQNAFLYFETENILSEREQFLINHVKNSIDLATTMKSKLIPEIIALDGMSSTKNRCLLNNLLTLPEASYLEIGCWQGSTFISALYGNQEHLLGAIGIDNWSEFGGPKKQFEENCNKFLLSGYQSFSHDCFSIDPRTFINNPVSVYFYDGAHTHEAQKLAFTYYNAIFDDVFIAIVDDWNHGNARTGTFDAFTDLNYTVLYETYLPARFNGDREEWWHGLYVAVVRK